MCLKINDHCNIRFIDSLNFIQMPLANFPKTFELNELKTGISLMNLTDHIITIIQESTLTNIIMDILHGLNLKEKNSKNGIHKYVTIHSIFKKNS